MISAKSESSNWKQKQNKEHKHEIKTIDVVQSNSMQSSGLGRNQNQSNI